MLDIGLPTDRDKLARHLYIHAHDHEGATQHWRDLGAQEWDAGLASDDDVTASYADADRILAEQAAEQ
ncbi:MAG TPA: hypothetical protein VI172_14900 [Candidatus Dormibacteraeota bacterium]|jgi:hypothetical protein